MIPLPFKDETLDEGAKDYNRIAMHPTFIGQKKQLLDNTANSELKPGAHIEVTFDNMSNYGAGKILRIFSENPTTPNPPADESEFVPIFTQTPTIPANPRKGVHFGPTVIVPCFQGNCAEYRQAMGHDPKKFTSAEVTAINSAPASDRWPHAGKYKWSTAAKPNHVSAGNANLKTQDYFINGKKTQGTNNVILSKGQFTRRKAGDEALYVVLHLGSPTPNHMLGYWKNAALAGTKNISTNYVIAHDGTIYELLPPGEWAKHKPLYVSFGITEDIPSEYQKGIYGHHAEEANKLSVGIDLCYAGNSTGKSPGNTFNDTGNAMHNMDQLKAMKFLIEWLRTRVPTLMKNALQHGSSGARKKRLKGPKARKIKFLKDNNVGVTQHMHWSSNRPDLSSAPGNFFWDDNMYRLVKGGTADVVDLTH